MGKKSSILFITPHFFPEQFKINEIVRDIPIQNNIYLITQYPHYPEKKYLNFNIKINDLFKNKIKILRTPTITFKTNFIIFKLINYLLFNIFAFIYVFFLLFIKIDKIFVFQINPPTISIIASFYKYIKSNTKLYIWVLDLWPKGLKFKIKSFYFHFIEKLLNFFFKKVFSLSNAIFVSSNSFLGEIKKLTNNKNIFFLPQWSDFEFKSDSNHKKNKKITITHIGNIGEAQDIEKTIRLIQKDYKKSIKWIFIGEGSQKKFLKDALMNNNVNFINYLDHFELSKYLKKSDYFLFSLKINCGFEDYLPLRISTYLSCAKPIINISKGEVDNLIKKNNLGFNYYDFKDKEEVLINKLISLEQNSYFNMCNNCINIYNNSFDSKKNKSKLLNLFL